MLGVSVFNPRQNEFEFKPGPIFSNIVLADEINRTTPKTQSALLEAMNENQVTIENTTYPLPRPFMVLATQNPVEHHGTYPLPESQLDRFMMKIEIGYPNAEAEKEILHKYTNGSYHQTIQPVLVPADVLYLQDESRKVHINAKIVDYMIQLVQRTRNHPEIELGISPRGTVSLFRASQALAMVDGRKFVLPDDVKRAATSRSSDIVWPWRGTVPREAEARKRCWRESSAKSKFRTNSMWKNFLLSLALLGISLTAALYSSSASNNGRTGAATASAVISLVLALWVGFRFVPRLAKDVNWNWIPGLSQYKLTRDGWIFLSAIVRRRSCRHQYQQQPLIYGAVGSDFGAAAFRVSAGTEFQVPGNRYHAPATMYRRRRFFVFDSNSQSSPRVPDDFHADRTRRRQPAEL